MPSNTFLSYLLDHLTGVLIFCGLAGTGGIGGLYIKIRRNQWRQARQVDLEAIDLQEVIRVVIGGRTTLNTPNNTGSEATGIMNGSATLDAGNDADPEATGAVEGSVALDACDGVDPEAVGTVEGTVSLDAASDAPN